MAEASQVPGVESSAVDDERIERNQQKHADGTCDPCRRADVIVGIPMVSGVSAKPTL